MTIILLTVHRTVAKLHPVTRYLRLFAVLACTVLVLAETSPAGASENATQIAKPPESKKTNLDSSEVLPDKSSEHGEVNINAATVGVLASELKGIGPAKATAIVRYREEHGAFDSVDALVNVKGIGVKTVEKLRAQLVAGPYKTPESGQSNVEREAAARASVQAIVKRSLEIRQAASAND